MPMYLTEAGRHALNICQYKLSTKVAEMFYSPQSWYKEIEVHTVYATGF